ncbi:uncharacterized protein LOC121382861 [Gigantopelta aegis]|uniref:uncharacterized protein LOC121382861 n=1 Tax=Gigantopelta aegis TaxID=1735272 RepID=UPI001B88BF69|nr:uncharacterized protein LOC121382861 [Gigantopelta aegis]XP_041368426.1 uncharacterized protein LOC121382861 [Gigantopelta aegis]
MAAIHTVIGVGALIFLGVDFTEDFATTTIDCKDAGLPGESTPLTCKITGTVKSGVRWLRPDNGSQLLVVFCNKGNDDCNPLLPGYSVLIDSSTGHHTLTIGSFNKSTDAGIWTCQDGPVGVGQISCEKKVAKPGSAATISYKMSATIAAIMTTVSMAVTVFTASITRDRKRGNLKNSRIR